MNKNTYRIIYCVIRGFIAVAENVRSRTKHSGTTGRVRSGTKVLGLKTAVLISTLSILSGFVKAQIVADGLADPSQRATILRSNNGVPVINIQTPNGKGVSYNKYTQLDVYSNGAVLNNSRQGAGSVLAGSVSGNPWLATGEAQTIINEIRSSNASRLEGNVEVAGQRADVIIANPSGINVKGAGFINANRAVLTTGSPYLNAEGSLGGFNVNRGSVNVEQPTAGGWGLGGTLANSPYYLDILSRFTQINAQIMAQADINVITGANQISADLSAVNGIAADPTTQQVKLDIGLLGEWPLKMCIWSQKKAESALII